MSGTPALRRRDKVMNDAAALALLERGFCGRLAMVGQDGYPYCVPLLYLRLDGEVYVHCAKAPGHLRANIAQEARVCFEVDEPGAVFPYGRFECDSSLAYASVILFGRIREVEDEATKRRFCDALMAKYGNSDWDRPKGFFPRLDEIAVYAIAVERITGKETPLPEVSQQWPALDRTKSPKARP